MKLIHLAGIAAVSTALILTQAGPASAGSSWSSNTDYHQNSSLRPNTGGGCNSDVCITVNGTGLHVNFVTTSGHNPNSYHIISSPYIDANGSRISTGSPRGINAGATSSYDWNGQRNFPNGTVICAGWTNISGFPCATVHN